MLKKETIQRQAIELLCTDIVKESLLANPELTLILVSHHLTPERKAQFTNVYSLEPVTAHQQIA